MHLRLPALLGLAACLGLLLGCPPGSQGRRFITDDRGRALILHGVNMENESKGPPWVPPARHGVDREDVLQLSAEWGFNFVRFLIFWGPLEPQPGVYDEAYLDRVEEWLDWFAEAGIHVVLDMHQDVAHPFPDWARLDDGLPLDLSPGAPWAAGYFLPGIIRIFDHFWDYDGEHPELQDHYAAAWAHVAARFEDHPAVLGYDIMNEPYAGSFFSLTEALGGVVELAPCIPFYPDSLLFEAVQPSDETGGCSPAFDRHFLTPFFQRVIDAIRAVDSDGWIFYEQRYGGPNGGTPNYMGILNDPRKGEDRLVFFPHYYSPFEVIGGVYDPALDPTLENWAANREAEALRQGAPLVLGEFWSGGFESGGTELLPRTLAMADRVTSGWALWERGGLDYGNPDGRNDWIIDELVRTYPQRVAGHPTRYAYDPDTGEFELHFETVLGVRGPTEIYVPAARHYPDGFEVEISDPRGRWSWDPDREVVSVWTRPSWRERSVHIRRTQGDFR